MSKDDAVQFLACHFDFNLFDLHKIATTLADLDCKVGGGQICRDAEGSENRDAHSNMATKGLSIIVGMAPCPLPLNPPVSTIS